MLDKIYDGLIKTSDSFKDWIIDHQSEPLLWMGLFFGGLLIFVLVYNSLQKEK